MCYLAIASIIKLLFEERHQRHCFLPWPFRISFVNSHPDELIFERLGLPKLQAFSKESNHPQSSTNTCPSIRHYSHTSKPEENFPRTQASPRSKQHWLRKPLAFWHLWRGSNRPRRQRWRWTWLRVAFDLYAWFEKALSVGSRTGLWSVEGADRLQWGWGYPSGRHRSGLEIRDWDRGWCRSSCVVLECCRDAL